MALKKSQQSLKNWTAQKWRTKSGKKSSETGERYLPEAAIKNLTDEEYAATTAAKREGTKKGKQTVAQPKKIAKKTKQYRTMKKGGKAKTYKKGGKVSNYDLLSIPAGPKRQEALAQYLSFSSNDINSIGVKNIQLGQFFEEGGMAKRKKSEMGMVPEAAPKRRKPLSDKEYFERQSERTRKGRASMTEQQKINMLTGLMKDDEPNQTAQKKYSKAAENAKFLAKEGMSEGMSSMKPSKQTRSFFDGGAVLTGALKGALKGGASAAIGQIGAGSVGEELEDKVPTAKSGMRFKKLSKKIQKSGKSKASANAIAASIGRKKYGPKKFAAMGKAGRSANA